MKMALKSLGRSSAPQNENFLGPMSFRIVKFIAKHLWNFGACHLSPAVSEVSNPVSFFQSTPKQLLEQQGHHTVGHIFPTRPGPQAAGAEQKGYGHGRVQQLA